VPQYEWWPDTSFTDLIRRPLIVAPMAGGPSTTKLIAAASKAGAGRLRGGRVQAAQAMRARHRRRDGCDQRAYGVNVFVPGAPADPHAVARYLDAIAADAAALGAAPHCLLGR